MEPLVTPRRYRGMVSLRVGCSGEATKKKRTGTRAPREVWTQLEKAFAANGGIKPTEHLLHLFDDALPED